MNSIDIDKEEILKSSETYVKHHPLKALPIGR